MRRAQDALQFRTAERAKERAEAKRIEREAPEPGPQERRTRWLEQRQVDRGEKTVQQVLDARAAGRRPSLEAPRGGLSTGLRRQDGTYNNAQLLQHSINHVPLP